MTRGRIGTVVEWLDRTQEVKVEKEIDRIVQNVKAGELSSRIDWLINTVFSKNLAKASTSSAMSSKGFSTIWQDHAQYVGRRFDQTHRQRLSGAYLNCKNDINATFEKLAKFSVRSTNRPISSITPRRKLLAVTIIFRIARSNQPLMEETAASMEELTGAVKNNPSNAQQANQVANNARELAEKGGNVVKAAVKQCRKLTKAATRLPISSA